MASLTMLTSTNDMEDDKLLFEDMHDIFLGFEQEDKKEEYSRDEDNRGWESEPCPKLLDELELQIHHNYKRKCGNSKNLRIDNPN